MSDNNQIDVEKKSISEDEFKKRVEIEVANLMYFEYMKKAEAFDNARKYISSKFKVVK